ncbi:hypothetical protein OVA24_02570 [Luteolibacter sp. SL250]|uniref:hypothetical protein n=1 Tax=Luteolibacter sp. SL250 TaxID=2995170 RepID=UPI0022700F9D|nr:hypothetical protein [Luteolibacter sp. SL250]WAC20263.1 hypothetical protein OVA24_02570 [Luteolibacter sp. SL250]
MKAARVESIRRRAVKAAIRKSGKLHHSLRREEILSLKVQVLPASPRIAMGVAAVLLLVSAGTGWPFEEDWIRLVEIITGGFLIVFSLLGMRRTLSGMADHLSTDIVHSIVDSVVDAIDL